MTLLVPAAVLNGFHTHTSSVGDFLLLGPNLATNCQQFYICLRITDASFPWILTAECKKNVHSIGCILLLVVLFKYGHFCSCGHLENHFSHCHYPLTMSNSGLTCIWLTFVMNILNIFHHISSCIWKDYIYIYLRGVTQRQGRQYVLEKMLNFPKNWIKIGLENNRCYKNKTMQILQNVTLIRCIIHSFF